jgi:hypothetical protein
MPLLFNVLNGKIAHGEQEIREGKRIFHEEVKRLPLDHVVK